VADTQANTVEEHNRVQRALHGSLGRNWTLVLAGLAFLAIGFLLTAWTIGTPDEAFFLQVARRVAAGEDLYGDVRFVSTPLSVYVTVPFVAAFGVDVAWVKLLVAAAFALSLVLVVLLAWRLAITRTFPLVLSIGVLVWAAPAAGPLYQPLAGLCLLGCFFAAVAWTQADGAGSRAGRLAVASGMSAGLAFGSKYTVGLLALAAMLGSFALADRPRHERARAAALAALSFVLVGLRLSPRRSPVRAPSSTPCSPIRKPTSSERDSRTSRVSARPPKSSRTGVTVRRCSSSPCSPPRSTSSRWLLCWRSRGWPVTADAGAKRECCCT
jgi:hypothetical protein